MQEPDQINYALFQAPEIVADYKSRDQLFPPEQRVFEDLSRFLLRARVVDLGVGGGRTTSHLISICRAYQAFDFSPAMTEACRARFPNVPPTTFAEADARSLPLQSSSVDMFIFSHNGIDCLGHEGRLHALTEIRRVLCNNGLLFFSSHSLHVYPFKDEELQVLNSSVDPQLLASRGWAVVRDNVSWFYYIYPIQQVSQLRENGFNLVAAYDMRGRRHDCRSVVDDYMIHYLCRAKK